MTSINTPGTQASDQLTVEQLQHVTPTQPEQLLKELFSCYTLEEYARMMSVIKAYQLRTEYIDFLERARIFERSYAVIEKETLEELSHSLMWNFLEKVCTTYPEEAFDPVRLTKSPKGTYLSGYLDALNVERKYKVGSVDADPVKGRQGISVVLLKGLFLESIRKDIGISRDLTEQKIYPVADQLLRMALAYFERLSATRFNALIEVHEVIVDTLSVNMGFEIRQGIQCLYSNVVYIEDESPELSLNINLLTPSYGKPAFRIMDVSSRGINSLYIRREYLTLFDAYGLPLVRKCFG